jgi:hypothetical protein
MMSSKLPEDVRHMLRQASMDASTSGQPFSCCIFSPEWNSFVEFWAPTIHGFVLQALGPYGINPKSKILAVTDGFHIAGANASFNLSDGQICLATHMEGNPGVTLEKLTHEMIHGSLSQFPDDSDGFYTEGYVDYSTWVMAHAPCWGPWRDDMIKAAADNIRNRRERAFKTGTDYDRKRWAGGVYAMTALGPYIIAMLRQRKIEGNLTW